MRAVPHDGLVVLGAESPFAAALGLQARANVITLAGKGRALADAAARDVARWLGVPEHLIDKGLANNASVKGRLYHVVTERYVIIDDSFNANPMSMTFGLETLSSTAAGRRRVAVLGSMAALGPTWREHHESVGAVARDCADLVIGVGPMAKEYAADYWFETAAECAAAIGALMREGDLVLVKGSNSVGLDRVVNALVDAGGDLSGRRS